MADQIVTTQGRYLYCVTEPGAEGIDRKGLAGKKVHQVAYKDVVAMVSEVPFKNFEANLDNIMVHQQVVESCRARATTLPVRFGVIFKDEEGVKEMLSKSYEDYRAKLDKLSGKEEFGAKVILDEEGLNRIRAEVEARSSEVGKLKKAVAKATKGTSYLLKIRLDEALKNEAAKRVEVISQAIHEELKRASIESAILKSEHEQIALNAAYLVESAKEEGFRAEAERVKKKYDKEGVSVYLSGPWAPYSFC